MNRLKFLGEEDFLPEMKTTVKEFREGNIRQDSYISFDGTRLNYYHAIPENPKGIIVMVHGMCEFFGKYHEYTWYLYRSGFGFYFMEQRGHGYSEGKQIGPNYDILTIDSYDTYVEDLHGFIKDVVLEDEAGHDLPLLLFAHSMGGAVAALFLEKYPGIFKAAVLSCPMFRLKGRTPSVISLIALKEYATLTHKMDDPAPGQKHFEKNATICGGCEQSVARFEYVHWQRIEDEHYQTSGGSFSFGIASMIATKNLIKDAEKIDIPVTVMTAGDDHLINPKGYSLFSKKVPWAVFHEYPESRHEIFNADDRSRRKYFNEVIYTFNTYCR